MAEDLKIRFDGPALLAGSMDVRQLAPALLALGDLFQESHRWLYPDHPEVSLQIRATEQGSFSVEMVLQHSLVQQILGLFSGDGATAIANVVTYTTVLLDFIKAIGRKRIRRQEPVANGEVRVEFTDGTTITVPAEVVEMAKSLEIRQTAREFVEPLRADGIEEVTISTPRETVTEVVIRKDDVDSFEVPKVQQEEILNSASDVAVSLSSVGFADGTKWRLSDGDRTFYASITDEGFLSRVNSDQVRFSKHDTLLVSLRTRQWIDPAGQLRSEHTVENVIRHIPAARQVALPLEYPERTDTTAEDLAP